MKKTKWVDDGRTIANMNLEGMPWYNPALDEKAREKKERGETKEPGGISQRTARDRAGVSEPLGIKETLSMTKGVLLAAMLVAVVFVVVFFLFILFCVFVWLK
ncbi:MAG: hypothetical protein IJ796_10840 [Lachnospiraceae bacterium]|nr:hypothetical protein [Lachnospiraceae bacterium]